MTRQLLPWNHFLTRPNSRSVESPNRSIAQQNTPGLQANGISDKLSGSRVFSACTVTQGKIKMQTIQYRRTRIWDMKKDEYTKTLAKNQVSEIFQMRDIGKNCLPKFIKLCMETPCWCLFQEYQYGRRIRTETSVFEFSY